jgi:hypothetical protein
MYPPGSGYPPVIIGFTSTCTTAGQSFIEFTVNKQILGSSCGVRLALANGGASVWSGSIDASANAKGFTISGTLNGNYELIADNGEAEVVQPLSIDCAGGAVVPTPITIISCNPGNASSATAKDATAVITVGDTNTSTNFAVTYQIDGGIALLATYTAAGVYSITAGGLAAGPHELKLVDSVGQTLTYNFTTTFTPAPAPTPGAPPAKPRPFFDIPLLNSLRYVVNPGKGLPNLHNRLYCTENWPGIFKANYYQKICPEDRLPTQFLSNYTTHAATLYDYQTGIRVNTLEVKVVTQNTGMVRLYRAWLTKHPQDAGQSRLYFNGGKLPLAFVAGDSVQLQNATPAAVNGARVVAKVTFDDTDSIPYAVLNYAYPGNTARIALDVSTQLDTLPYNVMQFECPWLGVAEGVYVIELAATGNDLPDVLAVSEPIALLSEHPFTQLVEWRNNDDARNLTYSKGFTSNLRVESEVREPVPGGTRKVHDLPNGRLLKLASTGIIKVPFVTMQLPSWLHVKLGLAFDLDLVKINGVEYQTRDGYEVEQSKTMGLRNGSIMVEEVGGERQNSTDLGNVLTGSGFIIVNGGRLKR